RKAFKECFGAADMESASENRKRAEALFHLLYSAGAWDILKDYAGLTGQEAGEAASWAMQVILKAAKPDPQ
ncbi:TetR/AcrR family transcriptional regulator, partial [Pseudomonas sp. BGM005]|nr:TetR/AcrR family transcriptional regulator [Pseudomonas sp. BG5]